MNIEKKLPSGFKARMNSLLGLEAQDFFSSLNKPAEISIRFNPFKLSMGEQDKTNFLTGNQVPWCRDGIFLNQRPSFTMDPLFQAGTYYVQEPSSMFLSEIMEQLYPVPLPLKILDLCSSPGGKGTLILSKILSESLLVSNETIGSRIPALRENLMKWGVPNVIISNSDSQDFSLINNFFDLILVDAPCSGEGLFRKDERAINEWSEKNILFCSARQKRILSGISDSLLEDGILIYSTCTFSKQENEDNLKFIAERGNFESVKLNLNENWNISESQFLFSEKSYFSYRFYPHKVKGEGLFIAVLRKKTNKPIMTKPFQPDKLKGGITLVSNTELNVISPWLQNPGQFYFVVWQNNVFAFLKSQLSDLNFLIKKIRIKNFGVCLGKLIGNDLIPSHDLAMSIIISKNIQSVELSKEEAIKYLRRQNFVLNSEEKKGWTLVKFEGHNLGWVKILENRINNYFPKEFRILMN